MAIQQEFLRETAAALGFTEKAFAQRMGAPWSTFEKWLLPVTAAGAREMPVIAWQLVHEIVAYENLKAGYEALARLDCAARGDPICEAGVQLRSDGANGGSYFSPHP